LSTISPDASRRLYLPLPPPQAAPTLPSLSFVLGTERALDYAALTFEPEIEGYLRDLAQAHVVPRRSSSSQAHHHVNFAAEARKTKPPPHEGPPPSSLSSPQKEEEEKEEEAQFPESFHCTLFHHSQKFITLGSAPYRVHFDSPLRVIPHCLAIIPVSISIAGRRGAVVVPRAHITLGWIPPWKPKMSLLVESLSPGEKVQTHMGAFSFEEVPLGPLKDREVSATLQAFEKKD